MSDLNQNNNYSNGGNFSGGGNADSSMNTSFSGGYGSTGSVSEMPKPAKENILLGTAGAFAGALAGAVLYYIIYQFGFIAGIAGLVAVLLANFCYQKLSGAGFSMKGLIISVVLAFIAIFAAEWFAAANEIYKAYSEYLGSAYSFSDALSAMPVLLKDSDFAFAFAKELIIAWGLGIVASFAAVKQKAGKK